MKKWATGLLILIGFALFTSCRFMGKRIRGNNHVTTENRGVSGFTGVSTHGSFDIYVAEGNPASVKIEAEDNILPYIETYVKDNTLEVRTKQGVWLRPRRTVKIFVTAPHFSKIYNNGTGNVIGQTKITDTAKLDLRVFGNGDVKLDVDAPEIDAEITGNGGIDITGQSKTFNGKVHGNGNIKAFGLMAENTKVNILGNGDAEVFASVKLQVSVGGNGNVRYKGNAETSTHITGNGDIKKVD